AVQIHHRIKASRVIEETLDRTSLGIQPGLGSVVAGVIMGSSILALVTEGDTIDVNEGYDDELDTLPQAACVFALASEHPGHQPFQDITGHRFAGMVPTGQKHPLARLPPQCPETQEVHTAPLPRVCEKSAH